LSGRKEFTKTIDKYGKERLRIKLTIDKGELIDVCRTRYKRQVEIL